MSRRRLFAALVVAALAASACGIQPDAAPRDLPADERDLTLTDPATGSDASGASRIYLVGPGEDRLLRAVPRDAATRRELIEILLRGPNEGEIEAQFSSFIPPATELLSARTNGQFLILDFSSQLTELTPQGLTQAIAQIVYTATELDGIEAVQLRVEGQELSVQRPSGEATAVALSVYDYPGFVQTAQPAYPALPAAPTGA